MRGPVISREFRNCPISEPETNEDAARDNRVHCQPVIHCELLHGTSIAASRTRTFARRGCRAAHVWSLISPFLHVLPLCRFAPGWHHVGKLAHPVAKEVIAERRVIGFCAHPPQQ